MKKALSVFVLVFLVLLSVSMLPGDAVAADGHGGGHGGGHSGGGWGHGGGHGGGGWGHGGGHGWGWGWGFGWSPWWGYGWGYPYYPYYYPYDSYYEAPATVYQQQPAYQESTRQEEQSYWYFCTKPQGYYPYVKRCPSGWLKVVPSSAPSDQEMNSAPYPEVPDQRR
jgi:hypothetical protein